MTILSASVSTFSLASEPDAAHNGLSFLSVGTGAASAFVYHPLTAIPAGATLTSATLRMYTYGSWGTTPTITVQAVGSSWLPSTLTWNNAPAGSGATTTASHASAADGDLWQFNVTTQVNAALAAGTWYGLMVTSSLATTAFYSHLSATFPPTLELVWTTTPVAPSSLSPSGGRAVATPKPVVSFDAGDVGAVQVQIDTTSGTFSSPLFDSGTVVTTASSLDLSATAYGGMTAATDYSWRARYRNTAGVWSAYSAVSHMSYQPYSTILFTNPTPFGLVVTDTPTITASSTGTVTRFRMSISPAATPLTTSWTSVVTGPTISATVPVGVITDASTQLLTVAVRDNYDREAVPGFPVEKVVTQQFTFQGSASIPGPDSLVVSPVGVDSPFNDLKWSRGHTPDQWVIRRDNDIVYSAAANDPQFTQDADGNYHWVDYTAAGNRLHHYRVSAKVGGVVSANDPTFDLQTSPTGIWIGDPYRQAAVLLRGSEVGTWAQGEVSALYAPLRGTDAVRVNQSLRGYEGDLSGYLRTGEGIAVAQEYNALQAIRQDPSRDYVIALPRIAFFATLSGITPAPADDIVERWDVSLHFEQQGTTLWLHGNDATPEGAELFETYDYEEGTNGATLTTTTNVGAINTGGAVGWPKYQTSAAVHGAMGFNIPQTPSGGYVEYNIPAIGQAQVYFTPRLSSGAGSLVQLRGTSDVQVAYVNLKSAGSLAIADSTNTNVSSSHGTAGWTLNKTARAVIQWTWTSGSLFVMVYLYTSPESEIPADSFSATFASANVPSRLYVGNGNATKSTDYDSVDTYVGNAVLPEPRVPNSQPEPIFAIPGAATSTGMTIASRVLSAATVNFAYSTTTTSGDPASPTYAGVQTIDTHGLVKHTITGLSPGTQYYGKLSPSAGVFVGDLVAFKTLPASTGAFSVKLAVGSCQQNQGGSTNTAAWDDIAAWVPDMNIHLGDYHYGGGRYTDATDWTQHMETFSGQGTGIPAMRQVVQSAPFVYMSDDHEFSDNNEDSGGGGPWSLSRAANILANQNMLALYPLGASGAPAAKKSLFGTFMLGSHVQVIMLDAESLERSPALMDDTGAVDGNGRAVKTFIGDEQETLLRNALLAPVAVNLIFTGKSLVGTDIFNASTRTVNDWDKPWNYPTWRSKLVTYINSTTKTGGGAIKVAWIGADRHANAYLQKTTGNTTLPGHPCLIASGYEQDSLSSRPGETYTAQYGYDLHTQVRQYMQITVADNGSNLITVTWKSREVHNLTTNAIVDGLSYSDTWSY